MLGSGTQEAALLRSRARPVDGSSPNLTPSVSPVLPSFLPSPAPHADTLVVSRSVLQPLGELGVSRITLLSWDVFPGFPAGIGALPAGPSEPGRCRRVCGLVYLLSVPYLGPGRS